ncbi:MAG: type II CRISPR RNA-guided endonuclease Cas9 [Burkholderiales bacterium]|nr:type II CRISPR RNA-guided endonuclease Cas9 [Burkholderiales bacterium]
MPTDGTPTLFDEIARVLSVYKDGDEVAAELRKLDSPGGEKMLEALSEISFDKFHALSFKALRKIVPQMEAGLRYDEACMAAGYHHSQLHEAGTGNQTYLPPLYSGRDKDGRMVLNDELDVPRNPVVLRALNQARKVLNALVRVYGSPAAVHIEMARDLSRPLDERNKVKKAQDEYRERNEKDKADFAAEFNMPAKSREFEKFQLYREQEGKCAYSLKPLDLHRVLHDIGYAEVDHALSYSRSFDDSKNNKVLVLVEENRNKGNRTAYEYLTAFPDGENGERWRNYVAFVESNKSYRLAKRTRLLRKDFGEKAAEEFRERNLNDTRYICRFFKNYVERYLKLVARPDGVVARRCVVLNGQTTAFLRARWGLIKVRSDSDRHHALDAAVVAACSHSIVKRLSDYARTRELEKVRDGFPDPETGEIVDPAKYQQLQVHFPVPWPNFRAELEARLHVDDEAELRGQLEKLGTYSPEVLAAVHPLFVSRAPQRRNGGAFHEATIRSSAFLDQGKSHVRTSLQKLKLTSLERIVGANDPRNAEMIELLRERLKKFGDDGKKAFAEPIYKPAKDGKGPPIRTVKLVSTQRNGMWVGGGIADLGEMHHVDIFKRNTGYHIGPVYQIPPDNQSNPSSIPADATFQFSLSKNDYVQLSLGGVDYEGYFVMYETDGRMTLRAHDQPKPDKEYFRKSVSSAAYIRKFHVDVLGNTYPARKEERRGLA